MKREHLALICGLALCAAMTGCTKTTAPKVTPTPSVAPTHSAAPTETLRPTDPVHPTDAMPPDGTGAPDGAAGPTDHYNADAGGHVESTDGLKEGTTGRHVRNAVDEAGNVIGGAIRGTGRAIEDVGNGITGRR